MDSPRLPTDDVSVQIHTGSTINLTAEQPHGMSTTPQNNTDDETLLRWYHTLLCCGARAPIASEPDVEVVDGSGIHQDNHPDPGPQSSSSAVGDTPVQRTKLALRTLEKVLGAVPIVNLGSIPTLLLTFLEQYQRMANNAEELQDLLRRIEELKESMLEPSEYLDVDAQAILERPVEGFRTKLTDLNAQLERAIKRGWKQYVDAESVSANLSHIKSSLDQAILDLTANAVVAFACSQAKSTALAILDKLDVAKATHHHVLKAQCAEYTRVDIRKRIMVHLSKGDPRFVWLKGSPGQGKTAIAMSLCQELDGNHRLAASFFFDKTRNNHGVDSTNHFVSALAYQLANFDSRYRQSLIRRLRSKSHVLGGPLRDQLRSLIIEPMCEAYKGHQFEGPTCVIVLDGLDECSEKSSLDDLMDVIIGREGIPGREGVTGLRGLPNHFVIFASSRPESEIRDALEREKTHLTETLDDDDAKPDIQNYVIQHLTDHFRYDVTPPETAPPQRDMVEFADRCGGLFLVAQIRVREVKKSLQIFLEPSIKTFRRILSDVREVKEVDAEYLRIFRHAYLSTPLRKDTKDRFRLVMSAVLDMREPLSVHGISQLLDDDKSLVQAVLDPICSVLDVPRTKDAPVRFYHATTREFLRRPEFWKNHRKEKKMLFFPDIEGFLAPHCLRVLRENRLPQLHTHSNPADVDTHFSSFRARFKDTMADETGSHIRYAVFNFLKHAGGDAQDLCAFINEILPSWILLGSLVAHEAEIYDLGKLVQVFSDQRLEFSARQFLWNLIDVGHHIPLSHGVTVVRLLANANLLRTTFIPFLATPGDDYHLSQYLDNRVCVFSVLGEFGREHIPVSPGVVQSYQGLLPHVFRFCESIASNSTRYLEGDTVWLEAHKSVRMLDVKSFRPCIVNCSALSANGDIVALAFGDGGIEISNVERRESSRFLFQPNSPPLWMEFTLDDSHILLEDSSNILWLTDVTQCTPKKVSDALPSCRSVVQALDSKRQMIVRVPRSDGSHHWSEQIHLIDIDTPDIHVRHLDPPELDGSQPPDRNKEWPYSTSVGFSPNAVHVGAFDDNELYVWSTETAAVVAQDHRQEPEVEERRVAPWALNRGIPDDSPICDSLHPSATTTALIWYKESDLSHESHGTKKEEWTPDTDSPSLDLQSANFIRITGGNIRSVHDYQDYINHAITRLYREGCNPFVDRNHNLRLGKYSVFSVMNTFTPLKIFDVKRYDEFKISEYWWIEKVLGRESCFFASHSADGKRILLKGKAFAPVLVDISGFLSSPLDEEGWKLVQTTL